jgi:UDP-N-acetylglucosamine 4,6-dehydratase
MRAEFNDPRLRFLIGDVRDANRITDACRGIDIVVHAAALKRVETCEADPNEAIATNITGTQNVARACIERGVRKAVILSTDKAAAPNTLYGMTKATAERAWLASNVYSSGMPTRFAGVRYGNVMGSTGSVIPTWINQAATSGVISITSTSMTRFWMKMGEAVDLVVLAIRTMRGGEILVPKIGGSRIVDLASAVVPDAKMRVDGARPGEKEHEMLIAPDEHANTYDAYTHFIIEPTTRTWGEVPQLPYQKVDEWFSYRSDDAPRYSPEKLREMAA